MKIENKRVELTTERQIDFIDVTEQVKESIESSKIKNGLVVLFSPHTTAGIVINHNEPMLMQDFSKMLFRLAPIDERYSHDMFELTKKNESDGRSNGHSHCKSILIGNSENIPLVDGQLLLGKKQSIFFAEFDGGRKRDFIVQIMGN